MVASRKATFYLFGLIGLLIAIELLLRIYFYCSATVIGNLAPNWLPPPTNESVSNIPSFYTDSLGIFKADSIFWSGQKVPVNRAGFRAMPTNHDTSNGILLIGDSFVWGAGASSFDSSFANLLSQRHHILNVGIPGADPAQYALLAEKYIPLYQPKQVIICYYTGNDMMPVPRFIKPYQPLYFVTENGWLPGWYKGQYFENATASANYYRQLYAPKTGLAKAFSKTAIGTALLSIPHRVRELNDWKTLKQQDISGRYLMAVYQRCLKQGIPLRIVVIPNGAKDLGSPFHKNPKAFMLSHYPVTFKGLENLVQVMPVAANDYQPLPDGHFNNKGHKKAAAFIDSLISAYP
ncbi:MAG: SGNH/GDSL hydrolase family protein [Chitinophagales bacterium]|nr:SGNH/GDSL hydrolase family protein [Chitinophagales bacterium]